MKLFLLVGLLLGLTGPIIAQPLAPATDPIATAPTATSAPLPPELKPHGSVYFSWGYNRDWYTRSDIRFKNTTTDNYDFTFVNAHASDKPDLRISGGSTPGLSRSTT